MAATLKRWTGAAFILGGAFWILSYVTGVVIGMSQGQEAYENTDPSSSVLEWFGASFFMGAAIILSIALLGVRFRLEGQSRWWGIAGATMASIAIAGAVINLVLLAGVTGKPTVLGGLGFLGVLGVMLGSTLLGIGAIRAGALPRSSRTALACIFFAFVPAIIATIPLESVLPAYAIADLPFPVVGAVLAWVGYTLLPRSVYVEPAVLPATRFTGADPAS